jgi:hypothetical protein
MNARDKSKVRRWNCSLEIEMRGIYEKNREDGYVNIIEKSRGRKVKEWGKFNENCGKKNGSDKYTKSYDINERNSLRSCCSLGCVSARIQDGL